MKNLNMKQIFQILNKNAYIANLKVSETFLVKFK